MPEIEAIATEVLLEVEAEGLVEVIPTARAALLTMDREGIRRLVAETLGVPTSPFRLRTARTSFGPRSSGKSAIPAWSSRSSSSERVSRCSRGRTTSQRHGPMPQPAVGGSGRVIVEGFIDFEYEITLLTVRANDGAGGRSPPISANQWDIGSLAATMSSPGSRRR